MTGDRSTGVAPLSADQMTKHRLNAVCYIKSASGKTSIIRREERRAAAEELSPGLKCRAQATPGCSLAPPTQAA